MITPDAPSSILSRCDLCEEPLVPEPDDGWAIGGRGVFISTRGSEVRREEVPLCASCASSIGMGVLSRIEIEEEEG